MESSFPIIVAFSCILQDLLPGQHWSTYVNSEVYYTVTHTCRDVMGWQVIPQPPEELVKASTETYKSKNDSFHAGYLLVLKIESVYPGTRYENCCISDLGYYPE